MYDSQICETIYQFFLTVKPACMHEEDEQLGSMHIQTVKFLFSCIVFSLYHIRYIIRAKVRGGAVNDLLTDYIFLLGMKQG